MANKQEMQPKDVSQETTEATATTASQPDSLSEEIPATDNPDELPTVATFTEDGITTITDTELTSALTPDKESKTVTTNLVATATPDGEVRITIPVEGNDEYVTIEEVNRRIEEAYLRGRNEAVEAKMLSDTSLRNMNDAADEQNFMSDLEELFKGRPSVWED